MFERFSTGLRLAGASWRVLKADRSLAFFPIISSICALLAIVLVLAPWWLGLDASQPISTPSTEPAIQSTTPATSANPDPAASASASPTTTPAGTQLPAGTTAPADEASVGVEEDVASPLMWVLLLAAGYVATAIAIFFNVALASCATRSMEGVDTKVGEGIAVASRRLPQVLGWAAVSFGVGLLLRALDAMADRAPFPLNLVANIGVAILGMAWSAITFLVVPVIAMEGVGPGQALQRSKTMIIQRWGEGLAGNVGISVAVFLCTGLPGIGLIVLAGLSAGSSIALALLLGGVGVALLVVGAIVGATLNQVFAVALYRYASDGEVPSGFDRGDMDGAFVRRAA